MRIAWGMYVAPVQGAFGPYPPSAEKVLRSFSRIKKQRIAVHGAFAANRFGLTTQVPVRQVYLTSGPACQIVLGRNAVELLRAPEWQTLMPFRPAGDAIRAMAYMGETVADEVAAAICRQLVPSEWGSLEQVLGRLPEWMAAAFTTAGSSYRRGHAPNGS